MSTPKPTTKKEPGAVPQEEAVPGKPASEHDRIQELLEQNHTLLQDVHRIVRQMRTMHMIKFFITVLFIILPILGAFFILPRLLNNMVGTITSSVGGTVDTNQDVMQLFQDLLQQEHVTEGVPTNEQ